MMASGVRVAGTGLGVGTAGGRSVIGDASQCGPRTEVAAESSSGEKSEDGGDEPTPHETTRMEA